MGALLPRRAAVPAVAGRALRPVDVAAGEALPAAGRLLREAAAPSVGRKQRGSAWLWLVATPHVAEGTVGVVVVPARRAVPVHRMRQRTHKDPAVRSAGLAAQQQRRAAATRKPAASAEATAGRAHQLPSGFTASAAGSSPFDRLLAEGSAESSPTSAPSRPGRGRLQRRMLQRVRFAKLTFAQAGQTQLPSGAVAGASAAVAGVSAEAASAPELSAAGTGADRFRAVASSPSPSPSASSRVRLASSLRGATPTVSVAVAVSVVAAAALSAVRVLLPPPSPASAAGASARSAAAGSSAAGFSVASFSTGRRDTAFVGSTSVAVVCVSAGGGSAAPSFASPIICLRDQKALDEAFFAVGPKNRSSRQSAPGRSAQRGKVAPMAFLPPDGDAAMPPARRPPRRALPERDRPALGSVSALRLRVSQTGNPRCSAALAGSISKADRDGRTESCGEPLARPRPRGHGRRLAEPDLHGLRGAGGPSHADARPAR